MIVTCRSGDGSDCWESTRKIVASTFWGAFGTTSRPDRRRRLLSVAELQKATSCVQVATEVPSESGLVMPRWLVFLSYLK